jgi:ribose 5-phosphate isomerase A
LAEELGILLSTLNKYPKVDLDVDGADEIDGKFNMIKGGGGAHTMEKRVANASKKFIVIVDYTKISKELGNFHVPVEVHSEKQKSVDEELRKIGGIPRLRKNFRTDSGNIILDTKFTIKNPAELEDRLNSISGVVDNGIFSKRKPDVVIVGHGNEFKILNVRE